MASSPSSLCPAEVRRRIAAGAHRGPTAALCPGYVQANLVVLPAGNAPDFAAYCAHNPKPCPLLERLPPGVAESQRMAPGADLRTQLPLYRRYRADGGFSEHDHITPWFTADAVAFLLGCSFTFEEALAAAGMGPRHVEEGANVPMYRTNRPTHGVGPFQGPLVVSMRPIAADRVDDAYTTTAPYTGAHGAPIHHGDPAALGISDLDAPHWGDAVTVRSGEVPVFWACGVTSHEAVMAALRSAELPWAITHAPGHMFISDVTGVDLIGTPG